MTKWKKILWFSFSFLFGVAYYLFIQVNIHIDGQPSKTGTFRFSVASKLKQNVKLHLATDRFKLHTVQCGKRQIDFGTVKRQWFEGLEEQVTLSLPKGRTSCEVQTLKPCPGCTLSVKQKLTYLDFVVLFLLLGLPLFHLLFTAFLYILDYIRNRRIHPRRAESDPSGSEEELNMMWPSILLYGLLALGVLVRVLYFNRYGIMTFQHDWQGHIEFIRYIAGHWSLPLPSKGLEFPQQPLYYWLTAGMYLFLQHVGFSEQDVLYGLGYFSLFCSFVFLYYAYRFATLVSQSLFVQSVILLFVSLTPSLVYMSARINNDVLVMALSAFSLYAVLKSYQNGFQQGFFTALLAVSLLFMTKISAAPLELLFFALLVVTYIQREADVKTKLYFFSIAGLFLLSFTFFRVYLPIEGTLHLVNSSSHYPNQHIEPNIAYFTSFHLPSLISAGQSYVFGDNAVRHSFLSYQYGTMFFGEFDYAWFKERNAWLEPLMQGILLFGVLYLLGFLTFLFRLYRATLLEKLLFAVLFINFMLVLKFMLCYTVICNTDFRYFVPSFLLLAFVIAQGLYVWQKVKVFKSILVSGLMLLGMSEFLFLLFLVFI